MAARFLECGDASPRSQIGGVVRQAGPRFATRFETRDFRILTAKSRSAIALTSHHTPKIFCDFSSFLRLNLRMTLLNDIEPLKQTALTELKAAPDLAALEQTKGAWLGPHGKFTALMKQLGTLPKEEKPAAGKLINIAKGELESALAERRSELDLAAALPKEPTDFTLPGRRRTPGKLHPLTQATEDIVRSFRKIGFAVADGPEIEDEYHCFDALNTPADHPARDMQDTFYLANNAPNASPSLGGETSPNKYAHGAHEPQNAQVVDNKALVFEVHGQGRGEEARFGTGFPSPRSSPRSFLAGRGRSRRVLRQSRRDAPNHREDLYQLRTHIFATRRSRQASTISSKICGRRRVIFHFG